jgi:hypothetical protein
MAYDENWSDNTSEAKYEAGKRARMIANARSSAAKKWNAEHADADRLEDFLWHVGEFGYQWVDTPRGHIQMLPAIRFPKGDFGDFLIGLRTQLAEYGKLSPKQTQIIRDALAKAEQFAAERVERAAAKRAVDCTKAHVGTVGERIVFDLNVERVLSFEGEFGMTYINLCRDAEGNVVVYKGSNRWDVGAIKVKATIKAHDVREGVPQTLISRPKEVAA